MKKLLPPLYESDFHRECSHILSSVCNADVDVVFPSVPCRPTELSLFRPCRMTKRGQEGKEKAVRGYVWLDTDPVALLFNKYRIRSCHTLDNTEHDFYTGNFTHLYNPYMACIFAGRHYDKLVTATSPVTGKVAYFKDGSDVRIRDHNAVANIYLMRDDNQRPYIMLSKLYQSTAENPWDATILRYLLNRCKWFGLGLAIGSTWYDYRISSGCAAYIANEFPSHRNIYLRTPTYSLPTDDNFFEAYGDDDINYRESGSKHWLQASACGILEPSDGINATYPEAHFNLDGYEPSAIDLGGSCKQTCYECGDRVNDDNSNYDDNNGHTYCDSCWSDTHTYCYKCGDSMLNDDCRTSKGGYDYCQSCFDDLYTTCFNCECEVAKNTANKADNEYYCDECFEKLTICDECNNVTDNPTKVTNEADDTFINVCSDCLDDCLKCVNCEAWFLPVTKVLGMGCTPTIISGSYNQYTKRYICNACLIEPVWIYTIDASLQPELSFA